MSCNYDIVKLGDTLKHSSGLVDNHKEVDELVKKALSFRQDKFNKVYLLLLNNQVDEKKAKELVSEIASCRHMFSKYEFDVIQNSIHYDPKTNDNKSLKEYLEDNIFAFKNRAKNEKFINSLFSSKDNFKKSERIINTLSKMLQSNKDGQIFVSNLFKKMVIFKSEQELYDNILLLKKRMEDDWSDVGVRLKIQKYIDNGGAEIVFSEDDTSMIVKVNNFETMKEIGTNQWCIAREKHYYEQYNTLDANQYILYDFTKPKSHNESLIGATISRKKIDTFDAKDISYSNRVDGNPYFKHCVPPDEKVVIEKINRKFTEPGSRIQACIKMDVPVSGNDLEEIKNPLIRKQYITTAIRDKSKNAFKSLLPHLVKDDDTMGLAYVEAVRTMNVDILQILKDFEQEQETKEKK